MFIHEFVKENYLTPRKLMEFLCSSSKNNSTERHPFLTSTHRHEVWPLISAPGNEVLYSDGSFSCFNRSYVLSFDLRRLLLKNFQK